MTLTPRGRTWLRRAGFAAGLLLLAAALAMVWDQRETVRDALGALRRPEPVLIVLLLATIVVNVALSALFMSTVMARYGRVGLGEMQGLIAAAALLNYLPLRPGLFGRIAYHRAVNGIAVRDSTRAVLEAVVISGVVSILLAATVFACMVGATPVIIAAGPLLCVAVALVPRARRWGVAAFVRSLELGVWAARYHLAFAIIGIDIGPPAALGFACCGSFANLVPFVSNGLGVREWVVGLLAPALTARAIAVGTTGELVNRAAEIVVIVPVGLVAVGWLARRRRASDRYPDRPR